MDRRNWLDLHRKLVDKTDMDFEVDAIEESIDSYGTDYYGVGCASTPAYPDGLAATLDGGAMSGEVSPGVAFDPDGNRIRPSAPVPFNILASDPAFARWDLLVLRYKKTGATPIPKPSDPIVTVFLSLLDDYDLIVIPGAPNIAPAYPAILALDVIVDGIKVPANAAVGTDCLIDDTVRMYAVPPASRLMRSFDGVVVPATGRQEWTFPQAPADAKCAAVFIDSEPQSSVNWKFVGNELVFLNGSEPPGDDNAVLAVMLVTQTGAMAQAANTVPGGKQLTFRLGQGTSTNGIDGQAAWVLPQMPIDPGSVAPLLDGVVQDDPATFGVNGQTITFTAGNVPRGGVKVGAIVLVGSTAILAVVMGGAGPAGPAPFYHTLTDADVAANGFNIPYAPVDPLRVAFDIPAGAPQGNGVDFEVTGTFLGWDGLGLDGEMATGMAVRVTYFP